MTRFAILFTLLLTACQQPAATGNDAKANDVAATVPAPPITDSPNAQPAAPEPATIPASFRGLWAENQTACGHLSHSSRLVISDRTVRYPSFILSVESVDLPTDKSFAVKGVNKNTKAAAEAHFSIDATGSILTDEAGGGAMRVRCG